jgi:hypothetical protein
MVLIIAISGGIQERRVNLGRAIMGTVAYVWGSQLLITSADFQRFLTVNK